MIDLSGLPSRRSRLVGAAGLVLLLALSACGGGGGGGSGAGPAIGASTLTSPVPAGSNVQALVVDAGPTGRSVNILYTTVTVCMPGSASACQVIDHVIVDTGSSGLRLLAEAVNLPLPGVTDSRSQPLLNCAQFIDNSYLWGPVVSADLYIAGEKAANLPLQVAGDNNAPAVPAACSTGGVSKSSINALGAKGVLGIGHRLQDCGAGCATQTVNGFYYSASGSAVADTAVPVPKQIQQPIALFASNNNGSIISLPSVPDPGAAVVRGALVFGIGTQANNSQSLPNLLAVNRNGYFTTSYQGRTLRESFFDSGSNGLFFGVSDFPICAVEWYCPAANTPLQATNTGTNGVARTANFSVSNAGELFSDPSATAFSTLAAPIGNNVNFDFGLPFFYGRAIATALDGKSTPSGAGPYVAY